jgi:hypothetical protein
MRGIVTGETGQPLWSGAPVPRGRVYGDGGMKPPRPGCFGPAAETIRRRDAPDTLFYKNGPIHCAASSDDV